MMTKLKAKKLSSELHNKVIGGWKVGKLLGNGKSAFICTAIKGNKKAAIKLFDKDLVEENGVEIQKERIERQLFLKKYSHQNLIKIFDGGYDDNSGYFFIIMQYVKYNELSKVIKNVPNNKIRGILKKIAIAAKFLEDLKIVHRDIKSDNVLVSKDFRKIILMDIGVIKFIGAKNWTDTSNSKRFIGTLKYSSPEFLLREEVDDLDGWRALTFYQLGAILCELINKKFFFYEIEDYWVKIINAIFNKKPYVDKSFSEIDLVTLANNCLVKEPSLRIKLVNWNDFIDIGKEKVKDKSKENFGKFLGSFKLHNIGEGNIDRKAEISYHKFSVTVSNIVRRVCVSSHLLPPLSMSSSFSKTEANINLKFEKYHDYPIKDTVNIDFNINILNLNENVIEIVYKFSYLNKSFDRTLYNGCFNEKLFEDKFEKEIFNLFTNIINN
jgi:serine/threonine protein kinase